MRKSGIRLQWLVTVFVMFAMTGACYGDEQTPALLKFSVDDLAEQNARTDLPYLEFMRVESMSGYLYELPAGATDEQTPHDQDEIYYVVRGYATLTVNDESTSVGPGDILFVQKFATHAFSDISEDLQLLVVFAPPDTE